MARTVKIDPDDSEPVYQQIARDIREQILSGEIPPRRAVPSARTLHEELDVSYTTVARAMKIVKNEGLVEFVRGKGLFVVDNPPRR